MALHTKRKKNTAATAVRAGGAALSAVSPGGRAYYEHTRSVLYDGDDCQRSSGKGVAVDNQR